MKGTVKKLVFGLLVMVLCVSLPMLAINESGKYDPAAKKAKLEATLQSLQAEIKANGYTFTVGYNPAVQYDLDQLCSLNPTLPLPMEHLSGSFENQAALPAALPTYYIGYTTPIKNQGSCGSCWAFAAVGLLEHMILKNDGVTVDLSEQYMLSCNPFGWGCGGGFWPNDMLIDPGMALESCFPYVATEVPCNSSCPTPYQIQSWAFVTVDNVVPATDLIKNAIYTYGSVQSGVYADSTFQWYTSGVMNKCRKNVNYTNHAILLIGWDDSKTAWRLKNSWGTGWGELGYMWITYGCNKVGDGANYFIY